MLNKNVFNATMSCNPNGCRNTPNQKPQTFLPVLQQPSPQASKHCLVIAAKQLLLQQAVFSFSLDMNRK